MYSISRQMVRQHQYVNENRAAEKDVKTWIRAYCSVISVGVMDKNLRKYKKNIVTGPARRRNKSFLMNM